MTAISVPGGTLIELPSVDPSVTVTGEGSASDVVPVRSGARVTVSLSFDADNENVVAAGIGFSSGGQIIRVPMPAQMGQASGTLSFQVAFPQDLCENLGAVCHSIQCYEYAITSEGKVSEANIVEMAAACGECTDSSCAGLLPECPEEIVPTRDCKGPDGKALPSGDVLYRIPGDLADLDRVADQLYYVGVPSVIGGLGKGGVFRATAAGGGTPELVIGENYSIVHLTPLQDSLYADTAFDGILQFSLAGEELEDWSSVGDDSMTDGESIYAWYDDFGSCDADGSVGLNRLDTDGTVTPIDAEAHCIQDVAVGGDYVYWLAGERYADITGSGSPITLYRAPKTGAGPRRALPLDVASWTSLEWSDGYVLGQVLTGFERGRPEDAEPAFIAHDISELTRDGATAFFSDQSPTYSCLVSATGGGDLVRFGSYDGNISLVHQIAAYPDAVYYTADAAANTDGFERVTVIRRIER